VTCDPESRDSIYNKGEGYGDYLIAPQPPDQQVDDCFSVKLLTVRGGKGRSIRLTTEIIISLAVVVFGITLLLYILSSILTGRRQKGR
jgi:hypothetical protein